MRLHLDVLRELWKVWGPVFFAVALAALCEIALALMPPAL